MAVLPSSHRFVVTLNEPVNEPPFILKVCQNKEALVLLKNEIDMLKTIKKVLTKDSTGREFLQELVDAGTTNFTNVAFNFGDLFSYMHKMQEQQKRPDKEFLHEISLGIYQGLSAIHSISITHNDMKPENILLHKSNERILPKICDFEYATENGEKPLGGTSGFEPPEHHGIGENGGTQLRCYGTQADVFAAAVTVEYARKLQHPLEFRCEFCKRVHFGICKRHSVNDLRMLLLRRYRLLEGTTGGMTIDAKKRPTAWAMVEVLQLK